MLKVFCTTSQKACIKQLTKKRNYELLEIAISIILCVGDGALPFSTRTGFILGSKVCVEVIEIIGLESHARMKDKSS